MSITRPKGLLAGYHADLPATDVPELTHMGEQWAPRSFFIPNHKHLTWELYLQVVGETEWIADGNSLKASQGSFFAVPPGMPHSMVNQLTGKHHFFYAGIDIEAVPSFGESSVKQATWNRCKIVQATDAQSLLPMFQALAREVTLKLPMRTSAIRAALQLIVIEATRLINGQTPSPSNAYYHGGVLTVKELIEREPETVWTLKMLAERANMSQTYLAERFMREIGVPPRRYLLQVRTEKAIKLLKTSELSIAAIAAELGFSSSQHLAAVVRRKTGKTPSDHRREG